jgi:hypothetical protein
MFGAVSRLLDAFVVPFTTATSRAAFLVAATILDGSSSQHPRNSPSGFTELEALFQRHQRRLVSSLHPDTAESGIIDTEFDFLQNDPFLSTCLFGSRKCSLVLAIWIDEGMSRHCSFSSRKNATHQRLMTIVELGSTTLLLQHLRQNEFAALFLMTKDLLDIEWAVMSDFLSPQGDREQGLSRIFEAIHDPKCHIVPDDNNVASFKETFDRFCFLAEKAEGIKGLAQGYCLLNKMLRGVVASNRHRSSSKALKAQLDKANLIKSEPWRYRDFLEDDEIVARNTQQSDDLPGVMRKLYSSVVSQKDFEGERRLQEEIAKLFEKRRVAFEGLIISCEGVSVD